MIRNIGKDREKEKVSERERERGRGKRGKISSIENNCLSFMNFFFFGFGFMQSERLKVFRGANLKSDVSLTMNY